MKKGFFVFLVLLMLLSVLTGCSNQGKTNNKTDKLSIVTTIFPEYDWVRNILGDSAGNAEITMLLDNGVDLHSYQPTADDMVKILNCDLFIYVGGESDDWANDALAHANNKHMKVINLLDVLGDAVKAEEMVEGMQKSEHSHEHSHEEDQEDHEHEEEMDEHVWLSLKNAAVLVSAIENAISELDPDDKHIYAENAASYVKKLNTLDAAYQETVDSAKFKTVLFGDRFPFRYLFDDYDLDYYAAFVGCSAETEASFETISFLSAKMDELGLPCVLTIEKPQHKIAETLVQNTSAKNQTILAMDSMQSTTSADAENGVTYLSIMEGNLNVLKSALNG